MGTLERTHCAGRTIETTSFLLQVCKNVLSSPEAAAAQRAACDKHNVTPRPVTHELCLGTFQGIAPSACTNACDGVSRVEPDLCGSVSASTWIPKHQAYKSCRSGYQVYLPPTAALT